MLRYPLGAVGYVPIIDPGGQPYFKMRPGVGGIPETMTSSTTGRPMRAAHLYRPPPQLLNGWLRQSSSSSYRSLYFSLGKAWMDLSERPCLPSWESSAIDKARVAMECHGSQRYLGYELVDDGGRRKTASKVPRISGNRYWKAETKVTASTPCPLCRHPTVVVGEGSWISHTPPPPSVVSGIVDSQSFVADHFGWVFFRSSF